MSLAVKHTTEDMKIKEYLTTQELSKRIKLALGTIRNLVWKGIFQEKTH